jgi:hypothetical protein
VPAPGLSVDVTGHGRMILVGVAVAGTVPAIAATSLNRR